MAGSVEDNVIESSRLVGSCQAVEVSMEYIIGVGALKESCWMQLKAANGPQIPYKVYMEMSIEVLGQTL